MESESNPEVTSEEAQEKSSSEKDLSIAPSITSPSNGGKVEVSAQTVTRMMGIASTTDLKLLEGRVDLLTSKVSSLLMKVDRVLTMFSSVPTPSDIGRLEIQLGSIKSMLREALESMSASSVAASESRSKDAADEQSRKLLEGVRTSSES
jgi:hypothetical protein